MFVVLSVFALSLIPLLLDLAVFESVFLVILGTPVIAFLLAQNFGLTTVAYAGSLLILCISLVIFSPRWKNKVCKRNYKEEYLPLIVFAVALLFFHKLCLMWPDFIPMGERLRDFSLLSSVIQSPIDLQEPWMHGYPLNYYAYWYRFGHLMSVVYNLKTFDIYHLLQSFTFALYLSCAFRLMTTYLKMGKIISLSFSVLLCIGSNVAGIKDFLFDEPGWWGPSRVIPGAIHEFPAWSFLLGDLHPHYLNLPLVPFFIILFAAVQNSLNTIAKKIAVLAACIPCCLWIRNSNAWELPIWILIVATYLSFNLLDMGKKYYFKESQDSDEKTSLFAAQDLAIYALIGAFSLSLYLSQLNIITPDYPVEFVKAPIERTLMADLMQHFGIPLLIIMIASMCMVSEKLLRISAILAICCLSFFKTALPILIIILVINLIRIINKYSLFSKSQSTLKGKDLIIESIGLVGIALIMVPEIIFLNDPYGADVERMNTIFKVYSADWFFIHIFAFYLAAPFFSSIWQWCAKRATDQSRLLARSLISVFVFLPCLIYMTAFFFSTAFEERRIKNRAIQPYVQGLSELDRNFPGSAATIKDLLKMPGGVVLEAQGKPYDYTSFISTLSEHPAFLGWANHVNLLLNNNPEVARREQVSDAFYNDKNCENKLKIMQKENINYVVVGALEKKRHAQLSIDDFSCLHKVSSNGEFAVFSQ